LERLHRASLTRADAEIRLGNLATRLQGQRTVEDVSENILSEVIEFLNAPVGAVYVLEDEGYLRRRASYALPPESASMDTFALGSGSVGQVAQLQKASFFNPGKGSFPIAYGFGQAAARQIVTYPMIVNGVLMGVVELCLFHALDDQQVQWLEKAMQLSATALRFAQEGEERERVEVAVS
jgi:GAF domain-containing protein